MHSRDGDLVGLTIVSKLRWLGPSMSVSIGAERLRGGAASLQAVSQLKMFADIDL